MSYPKGKRKKYNQYIVEGNICKVSLQNGQYFIIDKYNISKIKNYYWYISSNGYVLSVSSRPEKYKNGKVIGLHRYLKGLSDKNIVIDHINGDKLNNLESNLRIATYQLNNANSIISKNNTSGYKGVRKTKNNKYWAYIKYNYKQIFLGSYNTKIEAAKAYNKKALELWGEFARLNDV